MNARKQARRQRITLREVESHRVREWMRKYGLGSLNQALDALSDAQESGERRAAAGVILALTKSTISLPSLLKTISAQDANLVWGVANALGALGSRSATRPLLRIAASREPQTNRAAAVYALGLLNDPRAVAFLGHVLSSRDETEELRVLAADALGGIKSARALKVLLANHNNSSEKIRFTVINALGNFRLSPTVQEVLSSHLADTGSFPGRKVIGALAQSFIEPPTPRTNGTNR